MSEDKDETVDVGPVMIGGRPTGAPPAGPQDAALGSGDAFPLADPKGRAIDLEALANQRLTLYISGPMSGLPNFGYEVFEGVADLLADHGLTIRSPTEVDGGQQIIDAEKTRPYEYYLCEALRIQLNCNAWVGLPGWSRSKGAMIEFNQAVALNHRLFCFYQEHGTYWMEEIG